MFLVVYHAIPYHPYLRVAGGGGNSIGKALGVGGSSVKMAEDPQQSFDDVVGVDEAKADVQEIVSYLKDPTQFERLGGKFPKGVSPSLCLSVYRSV
jgi:cell division protease FtsH